MSRWYLIGGGPSAALALATVPPLPDNGEKVITTNHGLKLYANPTYYFVTDVLARDLFRTEYIAARARGTRIVTPRRNVPEMMSIADDIIDVGRFDHRSYRRGQYVPARTSGIFMLQFALNNGATQITLAGFDGYDPDHKQHNDDQAAFIFSAVASSPNVQFFMLGRPHFPTPSAQNFTWASIAQEVAA